MFKRLTWFTVGAAVGAGGTVVGYLRVRDAARRHIPPTVADGAARAADAAVAEARVRVEQARVVAADARVRFDEWRVVAEDGRLVRGQVEEHLRAELHRSGL